MKTFVVGIGYKARHGKDTLARELHALMPRESRIYSFANALKCYARVAGLMTVKDAVVLQLLGTDLFRQHQEDFWVKMLSYQIEEEHPPVAIVPDMRFPNEKAYCDQNGLTVRVRRLNSDGSPYVADDRPAYHRSETALDGVDFAYDVVACSGGLELLRTYAKLLHEVITGAISEP